MDSDARGFRARRASEVSRKVALVASLARAQGLTGVLLSTQHNFSWLSAGGSNRVDGLREAGVATLMVTADERRYVLANTIESRRIANEALEDLDFGVLDFPWMDERRDSTLVFRIAAEAAGSDALGSDAYSTRARHLEADLSRLRSILDDNEVPRYRELCRDAGSVVAHVARNATPGTSEVDVARAIGAALFAADMRPAVLLVGGDDRIASYRHPAPTVAPWKRRLLIAVCAERHGMIAALTRIVTTRRDDELSRRTRCAADVLAALLTASVPGAIGADLFHAAAAAYAEAGFAGEERAHHQGGVIAYRAREWVAHPHSTDTIGTPQAVAWNPTITGTKVEETCLLHEDGVEVLTMTPDWPSLEIEVRSQRLQVPDVVVLGA